MHCLTQSQVSRIRLQIRAAHPKKDEAVDRWREQGDVGRALHRHCVRPSQRQRGSMLQQQLRHALHGCALCGREQMRRHRPHMLAHSCQQRWQHLLYSAGNCSCTEHSSVQSCCTEPQFSFSSF